MSRARRFAGLILAVTGLVTGWTLKGFGAGAGGAALGLVVGYLAVDALNERVLAPAGFENDWPTFKNRRYQELFDQKNPRPSVDTPSKRQQLGPQ